LCNLYISFNLINITNKNIGFNKGDSELFVKGAKAIADLKTGDNVLIAEAYTHHSLKVALHVKSYLDYLRKCRW